VMAKPKSPTNTAREKQSNTIKTPSRGINTHTNISNQIGYSHTRKTPIKNQKGYIAISQALKKIHKTFFPIIQGRCSRPAAQSHFCLPVPLCLSKAIIVILIFVGDQSRRMLHHFPSSRRSQIVLPLSPEEKRPCMPLRRSPCRKLRIHVGRIQR
jgi:hypothetical protein